MTESVVVEDLARSFGSTRAVDGISFRVEEGTMFGLIGPDGAGKTTTLRCILGLLEPGGGVVRTCGLDPWRRRRELSRSVGYLAQRFSLYGDLTVDENVAFFARVQGVADFRRRKDELLETLRMAPFRDRLADRLSGGMRQKLALACTLIHTPKLLVLDEPTTGVDPVSRRDLWRTLSRLRREGITILLTTPYLDEAERCEQVALMDRGKILTVDDPDALREGTPGVMVEIVARPPRAALEAATGVEGVSEVALFGERIHASFPGTPRHGAATAIERTVAALAAAGIEVDSVRAIAPSLEDVFISRIRSRGDSPQEGA